MKTRMTVMIIILVIIFGGLIAKNYVGEFFLNRFFANYQPPAVTISSVTAKAIDWHPRIPAVGNFLAINGVDVNAQASGNVVKIHFDSGEYVKKDAPLIDIDDSVDQAKLKNNQSQLILKDISYKRQADLFKRGATSISNVDEAKANLEQAEANVEQIQAEIKQKHITAPFSGQLGIRQVNLGQYITPGQTAIVTLQSLDPLFLEFYLPEQLRKKLRINQELRFTIEAYPDFLFNGKISALNAKVDPNTHNLLIQATLPNCPAEALNNPLSSNLVRAKAIKGTKKINIICDSALNEKNNIQHFAFIPGMFSSIAVELPPVPGVVVLPSTAISYSLYGNSVFVIEKAKSAEKKAEGKEPLVARRVFVETGEQEGNYTVIKRGVSAGQEVVSSGELKLQNDTPVVINNSIKLDETIDAEQLGQ